MAPIFPLAKLAFLFLKQVARPVSSRIKLWAVRNPFFKERVCLPPARLYHWCEVRMKMYVMNITRTKESAPIPRLNEEAAIELGGNLLGEGLIFGIAVAILGYEVSRQKEKDRKKEEQETAFINSLENRINELTFSNEELDTRIRELTRAVYATQHRVTEVAAQIKTKPVSDGKKIEAGSLHFSANSPEEALEDSIVMRALVDAKSRIRS